MRDLLPDALFLPATRPRVNCHFRLAGPDDMLALHEACYAHQELVSFRNYFLRQMKRGQQGLCYWLIADCRSEIVGDGQLILYPHGSELANLTVVDRHRNKGIGTAMIEILTGIGRHLGLQHLEIGAESSNGRALRLYERLGFVEDRRVQISSGDLIVILRKDL